jgi:hypothetical protein
MTIGDGEGREELQEALGHLVHRAKRCVGVVGTKEFPTPWDKAHGHIDNVLDLLDQTDEPA